MGAIALGAQAMRAAWGLRECGIADWGFVGL